MGLSLKSLFLAGSLGLGLATGPAAAQTFYIGEIFPVANTFCPFTTTEANGQLLAIADNTALFSLYGTTFGGDGRTSFGLPDLQVRAPIGDGRGPGLSDYRLGSQGGALQRTVTEQQMPAHSHQVRANNQDGDRGGPGDKLLAAAPPSGVGSETIYSDQGPTVTMSSEMIASTGGGQPISTTDPTLAIRWCVALEGLFPSRP
ncbi:tail fiber protein [Jannaschia sp.]|nr:tail fiber protein [Jannaschia sp.]